MEGLAASQLPGGASKFSNLGEYLSHLGGRRAIKKVLIANNGIAAVKAIRSIRRWAYETFGDEKQVSDGSSAWLCMRVDRFQGPGQSSLWRAAALQGPGGKRGAVSGGTAPLAFAAAAASSNSVLLMQEQPQR